MEPALLRPSLMTLDEHSENERLSREHDSGSNASTDMIILQRASIKPRY
jgi:hypothetical protein